MITPAQQGTSADAESLQQPDAALARFERSIRSWYVHPDRAAARFWEAVDTLGFRIAHQALHDSPRTYGAVRRGHGWEDRRWPTDEFSRRDCRLAEEAYFFRGLRPAPERMTGPLEAMREREAVSRRHALEALHSVYQDPERAMRALERTVRTGGHDAAVDAALRFPPELGPTQSIHPQVHREAEHAIWLWARKHEMIHAPERAVAWHLERFRASLRRDFSNPAVAEALWREDVRLRGPRLAGTALATPTGELRALALNATTGRDLVPLARAVSRAEAVAHGAGIHCETYARVRPAVASAAIELSAHVRRKGAAGLARVIHDRIDRLKGVRHGMSSASYYLRRGIEECRVHLAEVVRDPDAVIFAFLDASQAHRERMLAVLRTTPALAETEFGPAGALVTKPALRRAARTAQAESRAPYAATWLAHLADAREGVVSTRSAAAAEVNLPVDDPDRIHAVLSARLTALEGRAAALDTLNRDLSRGSPHDTLNEIARWPTARVQQLARFTGDEILAGSKERGRTVTGLEL